MEKVQSLDSTHLFCEIHEQPEAIARLISKSRKAIRELGRAINSRNISQMVIAARGTSDNAARYAKYLFGSMNRIPVSLSTPSLFSIYHKPPLFRDTIVLGISQSGKSPDIISVLEEAQLQGMLTVAVTNDTSSPLAGVSDHVIDLCAGEENSVAATKTYTCELAAIAMLSAELAGLPEMQDPLAETPSFVSKTLDMNGLISQIAQRYRYMRYCVVIGRGYNYATAYEIALKLKELTYTIVEPYSSADFLHGPLAMLEPGFPVFVVAPSGVMDLEMSAFIREIRYQGAEVLVISDNQELLQAARIPLLLPVTVPEWLSPITSIIPGQLFAMNLAYTRDFNVDQPRLIHKVTETT